MQLLSRQFFLAPRSWPKGLLVRGPRRRELNRLPSQSWILEAGRAGIPSGIRFRFYKTCIINLTKHFRVVRWIMHSSTRSRYSSIPLFEIRNSKTLNAEEFFRLWNPGRPEVLEETLVCVLRSRHKRAISRTYSWLQSSLPRLLLRTR